jgi:hypothetical protein
MEKATESPWFTIGEILNSTNRDETSKRNNLSTLVQQTNEELKLELIKKEVLIKSLKRSNNKLQLEISECKAQVSHHLFNYCH